MKNAEFGHLMSWFSAELRGQYSGRQLELIAAEVKGMPAERFRRILDDLLGEFNRLPTVNQIRSRLSGWRETERQQDKQREARESEQAFRRLSAEEVRRRMQSIRLRVMDGGES